MVKRVIIIGASGSGKSTLARVLAASLSLPVIHIDPFFFTAGWVQRPREETAALIREAIQADEWVFEGNFSSTLDERAERADLIIGLELGRVRRSSRTLWRTFRYLGRTRPDMAEGCPERFDWDFHFDWVWNYETHSQPKFDAFLEKWEGERPILRLTSARQMRQFGRDPYPVLMRMGLVG